MANEKKKVVADEAMADKPILPVANRLMVCVQAIDIPKGKKLKDVSDHRATLNYLFLLRVINKKTGQEVSFDYGLERKGPLLSRRGAYCWQGLRYVTYPYIKMNKPVRPPHNLQADKEDFAEEKWDSAKEMPVIESLDFSFDPATLDVTVSMRKVVKQSSDFAVIAIPYTVFVQLNKNDRLSTAKDKNTDNGTFDAGTNGFSRNVMNKDRNWVWNPTYDMSSVRCTAETDYIARRKKLRTIAETIEQNFPDGKIKYENPQDTSDLPKDWGESVYEQMAVWFPPQGKIAIKPHGKEKTKDEIVISVLRNNYRKRDALLKALDEKAKKKTNEREGV